MLSNTGTLSMMDTQTRAVRSAPVAGWQRAGVTLFGVGGHRAYVVANDEAPAPIVTVVDLDSMAVTTSSWPRAARPPHGWGSTHMIVSPDERALYAVQGQNVLVFDTATMTLQRTIPQPTPLFDCIGQTDNGRYLFVTTQDGVLRVIEAASGRQVSTAHVGDKCGIVFDRGRKVAVPAGDDYDVYDTSAFAGS
ncbi:MAG: hypothetical protein J2P19_33685 [Pseudonocardia sp.]|nr:hypothetical protein [Pseudonocardia sp.]